MSETPPISISVDFNRPNVKVAVEIEGGEYSGGRHTRAAGYQADCGKYNLAADLGWVVYRFTPTMLERDPATCMAQVARAIRSRRGAHRPSPQQTSGED